MKGFLKLYAIVSVSFIFLIFALVAFKDQAFLNFAEEVFNILGDNTRNLTDIYNVDMPFYETLFSYLFGLYAVNIVVNIVIAVLAYLTEDKFDSRVALYSLIVNIVFFFVIFYTAKLFLEGGYKSIRRLIGGRR